MRLKPARTDSDAIGSSAGPNERGALHERCQHVAVVVGVPLVGLSEVQGFSGRVVRSLESTGSEGDFVQGEFPLTRAGDQPQGTTLRGVDLGRGRQLSKGGTRLRTYIPRLAGYQPYSFSPFVGGEHVALCGARFPHPF